MTTPEKINIGIIGNGGREHAFAWKISQSVLLNKLFILPGNGGTELLGTNIPVDALDFESIALICLDNDIRLLVVGPEAPLVEGIVDFFASKPELAQISVVGPNKAGAMLEGSKDFSKQFMLRNGIPTARAQTFDAMNAADVDGWLNELSAPYVVKADGLAAGKGVVICETKEGAVDEIHAMIYDGKFATAGAKVVVEEFLEGIEVSVFALSDGRSYVLLPEAKDYKRIGEGETGPNTGGMGAVSPVSFFDKAFETKVIQNIIEPTFQNLKKEGIVYQGFMFFGLINVSGDPYVIEYNARMGDPETEAVLPRIESDLVPLFLSLKNQTLHQFDLKVSSQTATTIVGVAEGYPGIYRKGDEIQLLQTENSGLLFHAGTARNSNGNLLTNGGRVMAFTGMGSNIGEALQQAKSKSESVLWQGKYQRGDIGEDLINLHV